MFEFGKDFCFHTFFQNYLRLKPINLGCSLWSDELVSQLTVVSEYSERRSVRYKAPKFQPQKLNMAGLDMENRLQARLYSKQLGH